MSISDYYETCKDYGTDAYCSCCGSPNCPANEQTAYDAAMTGDLTRSEAMADIMAAIKFIPNSIENSSIRLKLEYIAAYIDISKDFTDETEEPQVQVPTSSSNSQDNCNDEIPF